MMRSVNMHSSTVAMFATYRCSFHLPLFVHMLILLHLYNDNILLFSVLSLVKSQSKPPASVFSHCTLSKVCPGKRLSENIRFTGFLCTCLFVSVLVLWLWNLILQAGDVHMNPGPVSGSTSSAHDNASFSSSSSLSSSLSDALDMSRHFCFVHYNIQSLLPKLDQIYTELKDFDVIALTETWLNVSVSTDDLRFQSFKPPERKDRPDDRHGGVAVYIKQSIHSIRRHDLELVGVECIWVELTINKHRLLFGTFYRPPNSPANTFSLIEDSISLAKHSGIENIIVTGDFNFDMLDHSRCRKIENLCSQLSLQQCIEEPTHFTEHSSSLLDVILISSSDLLLHSGVGTPFLSQDTRYHCPVFAVLKFTKPHCKSFLRHVWLYDQGDYCLLRQKISTTDWDALYDGDIHQHAANIINTTIAHAKSCIPNRIVRIRPFEPPWLTPLLKQNIRKRRRLYRKAKRTQSPRDWHSFRTLRNQITSQIRISKRTYFTDLSSKLLSSPTSSKSWWTTLRHFIKPSNHNSIPPLFHNNSIYSDDAAKANILNSYFQAQTILTGDETQLPRLAPYNVETYFSDAVFCPADVASVIATIPLGKASGPDGLNNRIIREIKNEISVPLCSLFNRSLTEGVVPASWKVANVCVIFKSGDPSIPSNYRPISLLCCISKILEKLVFKKLFEHFQANSILSPLQSGFTPGDSTINQLVHIYDFFCKSVDSGKEVRAIFCDISKAFDRVWHRGLLLKLESAGVRGNILNWFKDYLSGRTQRVVIPGASSDLLSINAGVPQGSILGPLLFLLYINDIVTDIRSTIRLFADDTSLYICVDDPDLAAHCLNSDMDIISEWARRWLVTFNPSKTESLLISRKTNSPYHPPISFNDQTISEVRTHKHLGIVFSSDCSWTSHFAYIKQKAWTRINIMRKLQYTLDRKSLEIIYASFIRPIIEYGDVVWTNCSTADKHDLDMIQHEAARIVTGCTKLVSLSTLQQEVGWESLEERRNKHKLSLFFKMQHNLVPPYLSNLSPPSVASTTRYSLRNADNISTLKSNTKLYYDSFLPSAVRDWNSLTFLQRNAPSLNSFKSSFAQTVLKPPAYYYYGNRKLQVLHTRLRTKCSALFSDLYHKNIVESPLCTTCHTIETSYHYFFQCKSFHLQRAVLMRRLSSFQPITLELILFGNISLPYQSNINIFEAVQTFIATSKRFQ